MLKNVLFLALLLVVIGDDKVIEQDFISSQLEYYSSVSADDNINLKAREGYVDSMLFYSRDIKNDSVRLVYLIKVANRYWNQERYQRFRDVVLEAKQTRKESTPKHIDAKLNEYLADWYREIRVKDSSQHFYLRAMNGYANGFLREKSNVMYKIARNLYEMDDFLWSEDYALKSLKFYRESGDLEMLFRLYTLLGATYEGLKNRDLAIKYFEKANKIATDEKLDASVVNLANNNLGHIYYESGFYTKALEYFEKVSINRSLRNSDPELFCVLSENIALAYHKLDIYRGKVEPYLLNALKIKDSIGIDRVSSRIKTSIYFQDESNFPQAVKYSQEALEIAAKDGTSSEKMLALRRATSLGFVNKEQIDNLFALYDDAYSKEEKIRNKFARIHYETLEAINERNKVVREKNFIMLSSLILIAIFILVLFLKDRSSNKKKYALVLENQKIQEEIFELMINQQRRIYDAKEEEKSRISRELHDGVLNDLSGVRLNLHILNHKKDLETIDKCLIYIGKIQDVEKEIRSISNDLQLRDFVSNSFKSLLIDHLKELQEARGITYAVEIDDNLNLEKMPYRVKVHVFRIVQEAASNAHKHSKSNNVKVFLASTSTKATLVIEDDGVGMGQNNKNESGNGLKNILYRTQEIGGALTIFPNFPHGTVIKIMFDI